MSKAGWVLLYVVGTVAALGGTFFCLLEIVDYERPETAYETGHLIGRVIRCLFAIVIGILIVRYADRHPPNAV